MSSLGKLFQKYGSDKHRNGYTPVYHALFSGIRTNEMEVLEIGIGTMLPGKPSSMVGYALSGYKPGGSLRAWRDYFPNSVIHGVDVQPDTQFTDDRIRTFLCDSTCGQSVMRLFGGDKKSTYDVILDDGLHSVDAQLKTFNNFWPHVKPGGMFIVEDIYPGSDIYNRIDVRDGIKFCTNVQNADGTWKTPIMVICKV
jgi:hypothetical protein